ncbi:TetR/AcrR family transcriptional regulator [candidate division KSB1 bacterium]
MVESDTKTKIIETAEKLFAENGISGTSLRSIIADAGINLASIHYHFGSKEELIKAVFERRFGPINSERQRNLDNVLENDMNSPDLIEKIIEAFISPIVLIKLNASVSTRIHKLFGQIHSEPDDIKTLLFGQLEEVNLKYIEAFRKALPRLSKDEIFSRFKFMIGSVGISMMPHPKHMHHPEFDTEQPDAELTLGRLISFLKGAFNAPPVKL